MKKGRTENKQKKKHKKHKETQLNKKKEQPQ